MKKQALNFLLSILTLVGVSYSSDAQSLLKDLEPGNNVGSGPHQFTNVDGTMYFLTDPSINRRHALWKTDGTAAGTVMVKDSIISTPVSGRLVIQGVSHDTMYYSVNINVQTDTTTELWMVKNGSAPVLVTLLTSKNVNQYSNGEPRQYAMAGGKLFFQMYTEHGYELWVCDGTSAGTHEVADLFPGENSGIKNGGTSPVPMLGYHGKIYFQGLTAYTGVKGLYSSDGNTITLVKEGMNFDPRSFTIFNNSLYFFAENGLWKTDGTIAGTVNVTTTGFNGDAVFFKSNMYYNVGNTMYKSDGTTAGTSVFNDSIGLIYGMNSNYFFSRRSRSIPTPPYIAFDFWRSDGTPGGTERIVDSLGQAASFVVVNNKMYGAGLNDALWETDGTAAGVKKLITGIISDPVIVNNKILFTNFGTGTGYEPWIYIPEGAPTTGIFEAHPDHVNLGIYPNPSSGIFQLHIDKAPVNAVVEVYNTSGEKVYSAAVTTSQSELDLSALAKGIYFVKMNDGTNVYNRKLVLQ